MGTTYRRSDGSLGILSIEDLPIVTVYGMHCLCGFFLRCNGAAVGRVACDEVRPDVFEDVDFFEEGKSKGSIVYRPLNTKGTLHNYFPETSNKAVVMAVTVSIAIKFIECNYTALCWSEVSDPISEKYEEPLVEALAAELNVFVREDKMILAALCYNRLAQYYYASYPDVEFEDYDDGRTLRRLFYGLCTPYEAELMRLQLRHEDDLRSLLYSKNNLLSESDLDAVIDDFLRHNNGLFDVDIPD